MFFSRSRESRSQYRPSRSGGRWSFPTSTPNLDPQRLDLVAKALHHLKAEIVDGEDAHLMNLIKAAAEAAHIDPAYSGIMPREIGPNADLLDEAVKDLSTAGMLVTNILVNPLDYARRFIFSPPNDAYLRNCQRITLMTGVMGYYGPARVIQTRQVDTGTVLVFGERLDKPCAEGDDRFDLIYTTREPLRVYYSEESGTPGFYAEEEIGIALSSRNLQQLTLLRP